MLIRLSQVSIAIGTLVSAAHAQTAPAAPAAGESTSTSINASGANPYSIGVSQGFVYDSNVFKTPGGPSDVYSSTSIFGSFDQPIGRQRIYARGAVSLNRYRDESQLNNTSYNVGAGLAFDTVMQLSGNLDVGLNQQLSAPSVSTAEQPEERRNLSRLQRVDGRLRWGGASILTVEGAAGYSNVDYADRAYTGAESSSRTASLTGFYRPGVRLRLGLGLRGENIDQPEALRDPVSGVTQSNEIDSRNIDLLADYAYSAILGFNGRLSRTRQTNSNPALSNADFSGWTGSFGASYRATGRLSANLQLARNAGAGTGTLNGYAVTFPTTSPSTGPTTPPPTSPSTPVLTPTTSVYESNRITNSVILGATYSVTAKINASAGLGYARSTVASTALNLSGNDSRDVVRSASLGIGYEVTRLASLGCSYSYESRDVTGGVDFSTRGSLIGCTGTFTWR